MTGNIRSFSDRITDTLIVLMFGLVAFFTIYPFWNLLVVSLNDPLDSVRGDLYFWPRDFSLTSYQNIFKFNKQLSIGAWNSLIRTVAGTIINVFCTTLLGYALSNPKFILKKFMTRFLVFTMYISAGLIPVYLLYKNLGLINNFGVYLIPHLISAYNIIIVRTYMEQIPVSLSEAATIDGARDSQVFFKIMIPLSMPVLATISLFMAVWQWSQWQDTMFFASRKPELTTLQFEMTKIISKSTSKLTDAQMHGNSNATVVTPESLKAAMVMIVTIPILIVYPFMQKYFVSGVTLGAVKE